ncbi:MAG: hypothetical protein B6243_05210 [Anaerolineaceae bacterium 4572_5.2]|nr:MAG: hypothetical protein B6243_05210 [Anaerolineaceae bacterium 4572_5.2]
MNLPIPAPLRGAEANTFTHYTVTTRFPNIARRVVAENDFPPQVVANLHSLINDIPHARIRPLNDPHAPDTADWEAYIAPYRRQNWLEAPWFFVETYFYRRILEASGYFVFGEMYDLDPYAKQKQLGLKNSAKATAALSRQVDVWLKRPAHRREALNALLIADLWGNQADLSMWLDADQEQPSHANEAQAQAHILVNQTADVTAYLLSLTAKKKKPRVAFLVDNAGFELAGDLALSDFLLSSGIAASVSFHLKPHPTFVSDATVKDVRQTLNDLTAAENTAVRAMGNRLQAQLSRARLCLLEDWFWTSPLPMWEMPASLRAQLGKADLLISKGDANYRRLLGDRHWPFTTPFEEIVSYLPAPLLALRTSKSEVMSGLKAGQIADLDKNDPDWLANGKWGVVQFAP